uniref:Uncharacterized protein n=1 Tax=Daphnia galeata TaxID=27404 RepID=A0A8J2RTB2_9CRUS|nr:unnamed protein product [Daphnia galeata]
MECQAEAAALLPSFRELTSAGVVGRDHNGSPSDGSTDGSQQSQAGRSDCRFSNQYAGRFSHELSPWKLYDSPFLSYILQLSSTSSDSSAELSKELRLSSAHAMIFLSQQKHDSIQSSADETLSAHESTLPPNCLQSNDPDEDHLMLIQLQQDSPHGSY